jgi:hypothetical protein
MAWFRKLTRRLDSVSLRIVTGKILLSRRGLILLLIIGTGIFSLSFRKAEADRTGLDTSIENFAIWANQAYERIHFKLYSSEVDATNRVIVINTASEVGPGSITDAIAIANADPGSNIRIEVGRSILRQDISIGKLVIGPRTGSLLIVGTQTDPRNGECVPMATNPFIRLFELVKASYYTIENHFICSLTGLRWKSNLNFISSHSAASDSKDGDVTFKILEGGNLTLRHLSVFTALQSPSTAFFNAGLLRLENVAITATGSSTCIVNVGRMQLDDTTCAMHDASFGLHSFGEKNRIVSSKISHSLFVNHGTKVSIFTSGFRYAHKTKIESSLIVTTSQGTAFLDLAGLDDGDVVSPVTLRNTTVSGCENQCAIPPRN